MELNTAASVIAYSSRIEQGSAKIYENWAEKHEEVKDAFLSFAKENKKNESSIKRAYYSVISDALETGFSFKGLTADIILPHVEGDAPVAELLRASINIEHSIKEFYLKAAELSKSLMADVPRAMEKVARSRDSRIAHLESMFEGIED